MPRYTDRSKERVRDAVDFVELVSARTDLRRAGAARYEGLCPFHDERTPSFGIDPVQKVYYCFGCQAAGDLFTFVQESEGVDFTEALEMMAQRTGVELERMHEDPREAERRQRRERLLEILRRTAAYYERVLWESPEAAAAREYLLDARGLSEQALRTFGVGYAPDAWDRVLKASLRGGFSEQELLAAGIVQRAAGRRRLFDRFHGRIMFPLADMRGQVLGFGARALESGDGSRAAAAEGARTAAAAEGASMAAAAEGASMAAAGSAGARAPERQGRGPKYLNTSENEIYHKGEHLYGAHLARAQAAREGRVVLCEGYTDVIAMHQAGLQATVGLMGTALTERQLGELARMASTVLLALDADTAGQEAMVKAHRLAGSRRREMRVVRLPGGGDPAELIQREGPDAMRAAIESSLSFMRFQVERVLALGDLGSAEGRDRVLDALRPLFAQMPQSTLRLDLARTVAGRLELPESLLDGLLRSGGSTTAGGGGGARSPAATVRDGRAARPGGAAPRTTQTPPVRPAPAGRAGGPSLSGRRLVERGFLAMCLASPRAGAQALARLDLREHFSEEAMRAAAAHLRAGHLEDPMSGIDEEDEGGPELRRTLAELVVESGRGRASAAMLEVSELQLQMARLDRAIQAARGEGGGELRELARARASMRQQFDAAQERALAESDGEG